MPNSTVRTGLDRLLADPAPLLGKRIGFLGHPASIDAAFRPAWHVLAADRRWELVRLFGPEHGLDGAAQDMEAVDGGHDRVTGRPVVSLYGHDEASLAPRPEALDGLDLVVVDLVDVGARYYTFLATIGLLLRTAATAGVGVLVCDRPNPLGGDRVEGPRLDPGVRSFVGMYDLPVVHGLTPGEFALWARATERLDVDLRVVAMEGWRRGDGWGGLPWVPPSPNMPTLDTALVYPGTCLVEATNLSEGRGTTRPFELNGAPWIDGVALAARLAALDLPGLAVRPVVFQPTFQKHAGKGCGGVFFHVTDPARFRPYRTGCAFVAEAARVPGFEWRRDPYEFVADRPAIDLLTGSDRFRLGVERGGDLVELAAEWERSEASWREEREPFLLYPSSAQRPAAVAVPAAPPGGTPGSPPAVAFVGRHDSGKTTLVVAVVERLVARGWRVGTIKHTPHPVEMDRPGKDSRRHAEAGAVRVALVTPEAIQLRERLDGPMPLADVLARHFPPASCDLVIVEGYKTEEIRRIEVIRSAISDAPLAEGAALRIAVVTDSPEGRDYGVPRLPLGDADAVADLLLAAMGLPAPTPRNG